MLEVNTWISVNFIVMVDFVQMLVQHLLYIKRDFYSDVYTILNRI